MITTLTAGVLLFQDNNILLVKHNDSARHLTGVYGIPGGHIDGQESLKEAAVRECKEETGLEIATSALQTFPRNEYTADIPRKDGTVRCFTMLLFLTHEYKGSLVGTSETTPEWVDIDTLDSLNLLPNVKEAIRAAQDFLQEGYVQEG